MKFRQIQWFACVLFILSFAVNPWVSGEENPPVQSLEKLKKQIENLILDEEGTAGIAVKHLETGQEIYINGDTFFPMASVFKIPVFVEIMAQVKLGKMSLDEEVSISSTDQHLGSGMLSSLDTPGIKLSLRNLINLMMMISDNSATDLLLSRVGAENVNMRLKEFGIEGITVNRSCQRLILEYFGADYEEYKDLSLEEIWSKFREEREKNPEAFKEAKQKFSRELKDQSTPRAMNMLLEKIFRKQILDEASCDFILSVMLKCQTGEKRIKAGLPRGTKLAHKTGTIGGTVNNSGIIFLPDGAGHAVLTVFFKDTTAKTSDIEDVIAGISRFVFDYFYFTADSAEESLPAR